MRRILPILSFILLMAIQSQGQSSRTTPVADVQDRIIKLYPNPATSYVTFDLQKDYRQGLTIHVYNGVLGKKVFESANVPSKVTVDLSNFNRGVYIYHLIDANGKIIESGKFQVSR
ncbi:MAG TPA: T9SS type A sorting domain-containing protein [Chitinophagaceae bacterium]|nr:T9SS type A sorting domain-containing protein [Chitinophagaceae bacterium]